MNCEKKIQAAKGDAISIALFHALICVKNEEPYEITENDELVFVLGRADRKPLLRKTYPGEIEKVDSKTFYVQLTSEETSQLRCLSFPFAFKVNLGKTDTEIYTVAEGTLEVLNK